ncbi:cell division protein ZapA [Microbulbifer thermotolerans]|uniref:Cell division protein ZapA n=1 Tax=Microbulbifer thermotolerans TaxID=252514 RepID=A0A143HPA1_MICTH|nr:cell division protein ZapA [Microbulbifer thermotolerans]AMX03565.1 cell division protein ZapA [Microbulbifer thermotolerans]MCX2778191.1 cell division protein ZapA [Microbulbifer thermotolerans]MCX2782175.1 cell division protein ZapA [Microbulbifer thermotolerans]MCX2795267.1 cell division protein ZapA [Microbulbifer thermotolerans]MCX2801171.1 cell division protein ZapA [Microbulbifer thermotolerans]
MGDSAATAETVTVSILDKEYRVSCREEERAELQASARLLHERMARIRASGSVIGLERIAVMAALNIAHELIQAKAELTRVPLEQEMLDRLQEKVQSALGELDTTDS